MRGALAGPSKPPSLRLGDIDRGAGIMRFARKKAM